MFLTRISMWPARGRSLSRDRPASRSGHDRLHRSIATLATIFSTGRMLRLSMTSPMKLKLLLALSQGRIECQLGTQLCEVACMNIPFGHVDPVGQDLSTFEWVTIDQTMINLFTDAIHDHQFVEWFRPCGGREAVWRHVRSRLLGHCASVDDEPSVRKGQASRCSGRPATGALILLRNGLRPPVRRREGMGLEDVGDFEDQVARSVIQNRELVLTAQAVEDRKTDTH